MSLKGNLKNFSIGKVLENISENHHTGTLKISYGNEEQKEIRYIYFTKGKIIFVSSSSRRGFRLGEILIREKKLNQALLSKALKLQKKQRRKLGEILIKEKMVRAEDITNALKNQLLEEFYDLFLLSSGDFEFNLNVFPPTSEGSAQDPIELKLDPHQLINEGLKRLSEWGKMKKHITTGNEIFIKTNKPPYKFEYNEAEVYKLIDGNTPLSKFSQKVALSRFQCAKAVYKLLQGDFIRTLSVKELIEKAGKASIEKIPDFLSFALQQKPFDIDLRLWTAQAFSSLEMRKTALKILQEGLPKLHDFNHQKRYDFSKEILLINSKDIYALETALESSLSLNRHQEAVNYALSLTEQLQLNHKNLQAEKILLQVNNIVPDDSNLRFRIADAWRSIGHPKEAIPHLEFLSVKYKKEGKTKELVNTFKWILEGDPDRADIQYRLNQINSLRRNKSSKPVRRIAFAVAGCTIIASAVCFVLLYENKAKAEYVSILRQEPQLIMSKQFDKLKKLYEKFIDLYRWSTQKKKAKNSLSRILELKSHYR